MTSVGIVGGGIVGLSIAWRCARRGLDVTVYDRAPSGGVGQAGTAAVVAAGMLAPAGEAVYGEEELRGLMVDSVARWPSFAADLRAQTGIDVAYRGDGTLLVALTDDDLAQVRRSAEFYARTGEPIEPMSGRQLREREPMLSPRVRGGAFAPRDRQVDPRLVLKALRATGLTIVERSVDDLSTLRDDVIVVAAGCGAAALTGLPVRPVKGQLLRLRGSAPLLRHVVRGTALGRRVYLVPRADGELVVGATEEERGVDTTVTAGGLLELLRPAADLVPGIAELAVSETLAGLRPGTPDNAPIIGQLRPGVLVATGHYRNGVLLAPVTADAVADLLVTGVTDVDLAGFAPSRFT